MRFLYGVMENQMAYPVVKRGPLRKQKNQDLMNHPYQKGEKSKQTYSLELEDKHGDKFSGPQYKLWARLIDTLQNMQ